MYFLNMITVIFSSRAFTGVLPETHVGTEEEECEEDEDEEERHFNYRSSTVH